MKVISWPMVFLLIFSGLARAQSLGDVAKKTQEEREKAKEKQAPPSKVYTDKDLSSIGTQPFTTGATGVPTGPDDVIDKTKFDKVHAAAAAAMDALTLKGAAGRVEAVRTMREFKT